MNQGDNLGDPANLDKQTLLQQSAGVRFPAEKEEVAAAAEQNAAPREQGNLDLGTLQRYLRGVEFPATKEEVAATAESNGASHTLSGRIRNADTERFGSAEEVMQALQSAPDIADPL